MFVCFHIVGAKIYNLPYAYKYYCKIYKILILRLFKKHREVTSHDATSRFLIYTDDILSFDKLATTHRTIHQADTIEVYTGRQCLHIEHRLA